MDGKKIAGKCNFHLLERSCLRKKDHLGRHTRKKKNQTMSRRKSYENNSCLQIRVLHPAERDIYMGAFAFLGNIFSDYLQGSTCLPPLFSWKKIRFAFSLEETPPFTFAGRTVLWMNFCCRGCAVSILGGDCSGAQLSLATPGCSAPAAQPWLPCCREKVV